MYSHLDSTILQSKTMRFVVRILDKVYQESQTDEKTKRQVEYILRQFGQADDVRRNKIGRPNKNEKATDKPIKSKRDYNRL